MTDTRQRDLIDHELEQIIDPDPPTSAPPAPIIDTTDLVQAELDLD